MNLNDLERRVFAVARATPPSEAVPYAFEKRIMARLSGRVAPDPWSVWNRVFWRATAPCLGLMLLAGVWSWQAETDPGVPEVLAAELESVVCAPLHSLEDSW